MIIKRGLQIIKLMKNWKLSYTNDKWGKLNLMCQDHMYFITTSLITGLYNLIITKFKNVNKQTIYIN